jgi:hypothetical protein
VRRGIANHCSLKEKLLASRYKAAFPIGYAVTYVALRYHLSGPFRNLKEKGYNIDDSMLRDVGTSPLIRIEH